MEAKRKHQIRVNDGNNENENENEVSAAPLFHKKIMRKLQTNKKLGFQYKDFLACIAI